MQCARRVGSIYVSSLLRVVEDKASKRSWSVDSIMNCAGSPIGLGISCFPFPVYVGLHQTFLDVVEHIIISLHALYHNNSQSSTSYNS